MKQVTKDLRVAVILVLAALCLFILGGVLWMHHPEGLRQFFAILGSIGMLTWLVGLAFLLLRLLRWAR